VADYIADAGLGTYPPIVALAPKSFVFALHEGRVVVCRSELLLRPELSDYGPELAEL
jgi:hypothetical protein